MREKRLVNQLEFSEFFVADGFLSDGSPDVSFCNGRDDLFERFPVGIKRCFNDRPVQGSATHELAEYNRFIVHNHILCEMSSVQEGTI